MGGQDRNTGSYGTEFRSAIAVSGRTQWWIGICNSCQMAVLVRGEGERIFPDPQPSPSDPLIPTSLAGDLNEAKKCHSVGCYHASAVMSRRAIQRACIEKGCDTKKRLVDQIAELTTQGHITKDIADWATVVRFIGNDGAHPSEDSISREDSSDSMALAEQFLHVLFVTPALAQQRLNQRKAKKAP
jgi:Domain of unknown function (DUF4145)